jgi:arylformamidase
MSLIDISQPVFPGIGVFPGDTPFTIEKVLSMADGHSCDVSTIRTTVHAGTHSDSPAHFCAGAPGIDAVALERYFGPCRVVERIGNGPLTADEVAAWKPMKSMRYLVRTREAIDPREFPAEFAHFVEESATVLADAEIALIGLDTPSMDHRDSESLAAHKTLLRSEVAILENLDLTHVRPGPYELMAFPIRLRGADAAPVRAVLRTLM